MLSFGTCSGTVSDQDMVSFGLTPWSVSGPGARIGLKLPTSPFETDSPRPETHSRCAVIRNPWQPIRN